MPNMLDAMFELNRQKMEKIPQYCDGGGLDRMVETSKQFYQLMDEQLRLLELIQRRDEQTKQSKKIQKGS